MKILVVDDDGVRREALVAALVNFGLGRTSIFESQCSNDARERLAGTYFDLLIIDIVLPLQRDSTPLPETGMGMLRQIKRASQLKKPGAILGITAHISHIAKYREEFNAHCTSVIEAAAHKTAWHETVFNEINYLIDSSASRATVSTKLTCLTIHGIQTYGAWQTRLEQLILGRHTGIAVATYKYGYFSVLAFLVPVLRSVEVRNLKFRLESYFRESEGGTFIIFCHSFGTLLLTSALKELASESKPLPIRRIVLAGSVLNKTTNWDFALTRGISVVNECADRDFALLASAALVAGTGMAGREGFTCVESAQFVNRHFQGGHSCYFSGDEFMRKYWLPLLSIEGIPVRIDERRQSFFQDAILVKFASLFSSIKLYLYCLIPLMALVAYYE